MQKSMKSVMKIAARGHTRADYLHSSGYATAQNGERMGVAAAPQNFQQRQQLEANRSYIGKYGDAMPLQQASKQGNGADAMRQTVREQPRATDAGFGRQPQDAITEAVQRQKKVAKIAAAKAQGGSVEDSEKHSSASHQSAQEQTPAEQEAMAAAREATRAALARQQSQ